MRRALITTNNLSDFRRGKVYDADQFGGDDKMDGVIEAGQAVEVDNADAKLTAVDDDEPATAPRPHTAGASKRKTATDDG